MSAIFPAPRVPHFWRVNGYGYPCFFGESQNAKEAWETLLTFYEYTDYDQLKSFWDSKDAPRRLSSQAVESWKAAFEEFGLLFVQSRSNVISITPAGAQLRNAAERGGREEFAWIGLKLLLRYPLRGSRRSRSDSHRTADLLLYRFLYGALLDLDGYVWRTELERILCRVFRTEEGRDAIDDVKTLRASPELLGQVQLPADKRAGVFYNSINQVVVHAGMNQLLLGSETLQSPYGVTEPRQRNLIRQEWLGMVRRALSDNGDADQCGTGGYAIARLPKAPVFTDEIDYFDYLGAKVEPMSSSISAPLSSMSLQGEIVFFLDLNAQYVIESETAIIGPISALCQIARGQRLILSHDERWTYKVVEKQLTEADRVVVQVQRARPISDMAIIRKLRGTDDAKP
ncbi:hypothetical protein P3T42_007329 [Paraburkholderia sp. GAS38]|uniref:hypothetical protein n=1 Tax=Paraburkholderia sp. GAS38 TaxID=3035133 RepID=UPI003D1A4513